MFAKTSISNLTNKENSNNVFLKTYPVGSIYISTSSTNPSTIYGGTWERYGQGKTLVGLNESETEFNTINKTGGEKTHTLTINEMPSHNHDFRYSTDNAVTFYNAGVGKDGTYTGDNYLGFSNSVSAFDSYNVMIGNTGGSQPHNNLQPYYLYILF